LFLLGLPAAGSVHNAAAAMAAAPLAKLLMMVEIKQQIRLLGQIQM
jgi:hypothetical protein